MNRIAFDSTFRFGPKPLRQRWVWSWSLLACVLLFAAMAVPFWLGRVYVADDLGAFHLPLRDFYSRQLTAGESWDWMPALFCGFYVTGEGQLGGYHPLHLLLYRTLPLGVAFNLELLANYPLMAVGMYLLLARVLARRDAALLGSLLFTFCSFNLLHFIHPNAVAVVAHLPWLAWLVDIAMRSDNVTHRHLACAGVAVATGSQLLLGYPQYVWFTWLALAVWIVFRGGRQGGRESVSRSAFSPIDRFIRETDSRPLLLVAAFVVGGLLGAVQLLPTAEMLHHSSRQNVGTEFTATGSLHPMNLIQPLAPYVFASRVVGQNTHELSCYLGAVPLVLCAWLLLNLRRFNARDRRVVALAATLVAVGLLYALGEHGPLSWLQAHLPLVNRFRFPTRAVVLLQFGVAILAALSFKRLTGEPEALAPGARAPSDIAILNAGHPSLARRANTLRLLPIISAIVSFAAWLSFREFANSFAWLLVGPALIAVAAALVLQIAQGSRMAIVGLIGLAAVDAATYGMSYAVWPRTSDLNQFVANANHPPSNELHGRLLADDRDPNTPLRAGNRLLLAGYALADGYAGLEPALKGATTSNDFTRHAGVAWQFDCNAWHPLPSPLPQVRLTAGAGDVNILARRAGYFALRVHSDEAVTLIVAESHFPGWQATCNAAPLAVQPTDDGFMQLNLPAGTSHIELTFAPASLKLGRTLSLCGLSLLMAWVAVALLLHRKPVAELATAPAAHQQLTTSI